MVKPGGSEDSIRTLLTAGKDLGVAVTEFAFIDVPPDGRVLAYAIDGVSPDFAWHSTLKNCAPAGPTGSRW